LKKVVEMHIKKISTSLFQVFAIVSISVSAYAWQISPQEQAKKDTERKNILNKELSAEQSRLSRLTNVLQQAIISKQPTQAIALDIARHKGNIDSLNKELGIVILSAKNDAVVDVKSDVRAPLVLPKVAMTSNKNILANNQKRQTAKALKPNMLVSHNPFVQSQYQSQMLTVFKSN
jgi:hypothetical protein